MLKKFLFKICAILLCVELISVLLLLVLPLPLVFLLLLLLL